MTGNNADMEQASLCGDFCEQNTSFDIQQDPALSFLVDGFLRFCGKAYHSCAGETAFAPAHRGHGHSPIHDSSHAHHHAAVVHADHNVLRADFHQHSSCMQELVLHGQHPKALVYCCDDSRAVATNVFDASPGEIFVQSSIGALTPPRGTIGRLAGRFAPSLAPVIQQFNGMAHIESALQYAVGHLHVPAVIHLGHTQCGGLKGLVDGSTTGYLKSWVDKGRPLLPAAQRRFAPQTQQEMYAAVEKENIIASVRGIEQRMRVDFAETPEIIPPVYGLLFDMAEGSLNLLTDSARGTFVQLASYRDVVGSSHAAVCHAGHICHAKSSSAAVPRVVTGSGTVVHPNFGG